jgi:hypothetical protein
LNFNRHTNAACGCRNWDDSSRTWHSFTDMLLFRKTQALVRG